MKISPIAGAGAVQDLSTPDHIRTAKMVAAFNKASEPAQAPIEQPRHLADVPVNANKISPEELSAVQPPQEAQESDTPAVIEPETEDTQVDPELERRFKQLSRQERILRAKIQQQNIEFKKREEALKVREAAIQQPDLSSYIPKDRLKQDPLSALEEAQVSWDELSQQAINRQPTDPRVMNTIQRLESQIADMQKKADQAQVNYQEQQQQQYQAALKQIKADAKQLIYTDPEFETVKAMNAVNDVVELIERTYAKDGVVLSVEEATREVENYLIDEAMKITQIDKIKKRLAVSKAQTLKADVKPPLTQQPQMKTLTNAQSSARKMSARERAIARATGFKGDF